MKKSLPVLAILLLTLSCTDVANEENTQKELDALRIELEHLKLQNAESTQEKKEQIATFLTFQENNAEEAMNFYVALFENSKVIEVQRYGKDGPAKEGSILFARFELNGSQFVCSDSYMKHEWTFTPGVSNWVDCKTDEEIEKLFSKLSENGNVLMPLGSYDWSEKFAFVEDQFGVFWQLNLG